MVGGTNRQQGLDIRHQGVGHGDIAGMGIRTAAAAGGGTMGQIGISWTIDSTGGS